MSSLDESPNNTASSQLFFCPEDGWIKSYQRFPALKHHLDCEKHERKLERETFLSKAVHGYAARLERQTASVPQLQQCARSHRTLNRSLLSMGRALKSGQASRARFTDKQNNFLLRKILIREQIGQTLNASRVAVIPWIHCTKSQRFRHLRSRYATKQHPRENPRTVHEFARIYDVKMTQFVLKIEKLSHIMGTRGSQ